MVLLPRSFSARRAAAVLAAAVVAAGACAAAPLDEPLQPIPLPQPAAAPARVEIGRLLFDDTRLSGNGRRACSHCHDLRHGGADGRVRSPGADGRLTASNTPTVLNAALNFRQFWNGRVETLEAQVDDVVRNPVEMGATWAGVVQSLAADARYRKLFGAAYKDGISAANIQNAIAEFERTLTTPNSRFDRYLRGDANAIDADEKAGYAAFKRYGCVACHQGVNVGGNMFQKFGIMGDYLGRRATVSAADRGRLEVTGLESDRYVFKVPGLRNVELTAPYLHDGSAATLQAAVDIMFRVQLGRTASAQDKASIIAFLRTLTAAPAAAP